MPLITFQSRLANRHTHPGPLISTLSLLPVFYPTRVTLREGKLVLRNEVLYDFERWFLGHVGFHLNGLSSSGEVGLNNT